MVTGEAHEALGKEGALLESDLEARAQQAYESALRITSTTGHRFIGEWRASPRRRARSPRVTSKKSS
jgi:hypothetical protein